MKLLSSLLFVFTCVFISCLSLSCRVGPCFRLTTYLLLFFDFDNRRSNRKGKWTRCRCKDRRCVYTPRWVIVRQDNDKARGQNKTRHTDKTKTHRQVKSRQDTHRQDKTKTATWERQDGIVKGNAFVNWRLVLYSSLSSFPSCFVLSTCLSLPMFLVLHLITFYFDPFVLS